MTTQNLDSRNRSTQLISAVSVIAVVALMAVVAFSAFAAGRDDSDGNGTVVPPAPSRSPSTPVGTSAPPEKPGPETLKVDLGNATGADVTVDIADRTGFLVDARSGTPGDGMSVEPYTLKVENVDPTTLRLTWIDYPIDNALALFIDESDGAVRLLLVQPAPTGLTDSIGFDRELMLVFSQPIAAERVDAFLQEGLDTPG